MAAKTYVSDYDGTMVRTTAGRFDVVNKGGALPADADADHVQVLLDRQMIHEGDPVAGVVFDPDAAPPFPGVDEEPASGARGRAKS